MVFVTLLLCLHVKATRCPVNVACFCCWFGSPQLTLALCSAAWCHSRFVPQCAGDENGCPLRNSRNFHLALPVSVAVHGTVYIKRFCCTVSADCTWLLLGINIYKYCNFKKAYKMLQTTYMCRVKHITYIFIYHPSLLRAYIFYSTRTE